MSDLEIRRRRALEILASTGMREISYAPPLHQLAWRCGMGLRPPHFARPWQNFAWFGGCFATCLSIASFALLSERVFELRTPVLAGIIFGGLNTAYFAIGRHRHSLPRWEQLSETAEGLD